MSAMARAYCAIVVLHSCSTALAGDGTLTPLPTSVVNYYIRGTQPNALVEVIQPPDDCGACHGGVPDKKADWDGSLMAQSARDPLFYAALDIAEADAPGIGDTCLRCHAPQGWLEGRAIPTDGSGLDWSDREGVSCAVCHRMVDPFNGPGAPSVDAGILNALGLDSPLQSFDLLGLPGNVGNGSYVIDPENRIRGPFPIGTLPTPQNLPPSTNCQWWHMAFLGQPAYESPLHGRSELCATCHDVSTPHFIYNSISQKFEFDFDNPETIEPNSNKYRMMPQQRTYSEWLHSEFASAGVNMNGRFGGLGQALITDCQSCHMPRSSGFICNLTHINRNDMARHVFSGAATWVLDAVARAFGTAGTFEINFDEELAVMAAIPRNQKMLKCAADLDVTIDNTPVPGVPQLRVRVINQTGHKLPTGFPEGRRMWLTVEFYNDCVEPGVPVVVHGAWNSATLTLDSGTTKVYEAKVGPDDVVASMTATSEGPSYHMAIANKTYKDNRIPPRGFSNAAFAAVNAAPVAAIYADGQFWDDTLFPIPPHATGVRVKLCYETASRSYIEFLRDNNPFLGQPDNRGQFLYDLWNNGGNPPQPLLIASFPPTQEFDDGAPPCTLPPQNLQILDPDHDGIFALGAKGDINGDFVFDDADVAAFVDAIVNKVVDPAILCKADFVPDGALNGKDVQGFVELLLQ